MKESSLMELKFGANNCFKTRQTFNPFRKMESINLVKDALLIVFAMTSHSYHVIYVGNVYFWEFLICMNCPWMYLLLTEIEKQ